MTISDVLIIAATIAGPILAVQAQKWTERYREARSQKVVVFSTLMTNRATTLVPDCVQALNSIDIVFKDDPEIVQLWHEYLDALSPVNPTTQDKLVELLFGMSKSLGFGFNKVMLKRGAYLPQGHVDADALQAESQRNLNKMLVSQQEIQQQLREYLEGKKSLKIQIDSGDQIRP